MHGLVGMRIPRSIQLWPSTGTVHLFWRCHNRDFHLRSKATKKLYFECLEKALKYRKNGESCQIHSFCAMDNHFHQTVSYTGGWERLSATFHYGHGLFGARFNRATKRTGAVFNGRPKTPLIQNQAHERRVHFYVEANPIRAGLCKLEELKNNPYSSYAFYAHGKRSKFTYLLTIPNWYIQLGNTWKSRQRRYRKLFELYLGVDKKNEDSLHQGLYLGEEQWVEVARSTVRCWVSHRQQKHSPISIESS